MIDDSQIIDRLIIREQIPIIEQILIPIIIGGGPGGSSSPPTSSVVNQNLRTVNQNIRIINQKINNNKLDIKKLDDQINFIKNKGNLTVNQRAYLDKLTKLKMDREKFLSKTNDIHKRTKDDYKKVFQQKKEIFRSKEQQSQKQKEFNKQHGGGKTPSGGYSPPPTTPSTPPSQPPSQTGPPKIKPCGNGIWSCGVCCCPDKRHCDRLPSKFSPWGQGPFNITRELLEECRACGCWPPPYE